MAGWLDNVYWPVKLRPRVDFNIDDFLRLIKSKGVEAVWYTSAKCPCNTRNPMHDHVINSPRTDCNVCNGDGYEYFNPQAVTLIAIGLRRDFNQFEKYQPMAMGEAQFTVRGEHAPGYFDRIVLNDARTTRSEMFARKSDESKDEHVDRLTYPIVDMTYLDQDGDPHTVGVVQIRRHGGSDGQPGSVMIEGVDFEVTVDGYIDWTLGDALNTSPELGRLYSVVYKTRPYYRITSFTHAVRDTRTRLKSPTEKPDVLPVQFTAKLEWLVTEEA